jgi:hypothetical protein
MLKDACLYGEEDLLDLAFSKSGKRASSVRHRVGLQEKSERGDLVVAWDSTSSTPAKRMNSSSGTGTVGGGRFVFIDLLPSFSGAGALGLIDSIVAEPSCRGYSAGRRVQGG